MTVGLADRLIKDRPFKDIKEVQDRIPREVWEKFKLPVGISTRVQFEGKKEEGATPPELVDLNTAPAADLLKLDPIMTKELVEEIIKGRPYSSIQELKERIPVEVFEKIKGKLVIPAIPVPQKREPIKIAQ